MSRLITWNIARFGRLSLQRERREVRFIYVSQRGEPQPLTSRSKDQWVIVTGVPTETDLKKFSAMNSGMRMQPCEAG
jgi:hypothetical protein